MESISSLDRRVDVENSSKNIDVSWCYYVDCEIECDLYNVECNAVLVLTANCRMLTNFLLFARLGCEADTDSAEL